MAEVEAPAAAVAAATPEVATVTEGGAATEAKGPHKLHRQWTFCLYDHVFRPSKLPGTADFHLFKAGVEPKWEDPECANGGKWTVPCNRKPTFETMWLETLMALVGEQFDETDDICGIVASVRPRGDKLALWTRTASNEAVQVNIGKKWKDVIDYNDKIIYTFHDDSRRDKPSRGGRYTV
uniref:eIF-(iso)4F 25 kDa subunit n=1 Tax=Zea mays TaxID=4577 RepID=B6SGM2_MAIZE|nr:eukaryotic translation initiation factor 4E-2 [Zea mays]|eukprot:XP_008678345.1 uncharacterized protein LOC100284181 isoform X1 [Zea mays]